MPLNPGTKLGPYQILAPLGAGGMGEVYRAHDSRLGRDVAIKVLPQHLAATAELRARFEREARTVSQLNHPHICTLYDIGRERGTDYLVMELLEGETLAARLAKGALPPAEVLALGRQIAEALDRAHRAGVVHRDLKPANVMLTRGGVKLMDFGLAQANGPAGFTGAGASSMGTHAPTVATPLTAAGTIVGTFQYMAPEQLEGKATDARTDLWALGCVLYEMTAGQRAFAGESQASLIAAIMEREPRPITELQPVTPPALERVVRRCLQKDPAARFQSASDLAFMLELIAGADVRAGVPVPAPRPRRGAPLAVAALVLAVAAAAFAAGRMLAGPAAPGAIRVTDLSHGNRDTEPAVSPDGRLIAFSAARPGGRGIWLMDMASRGEVRLTTGADEQPRFSPDGGSALFTRVTESRSSVWRIPVLGGSPRLVADNAYDADWSPDGGRVAFLSGSGDSASALARLMTARLDGTDLRELHSASGTVFTNPRWSLDGRRVALIRAGSQNAPNAVILVDVAAGATREYPSPRSGVLSPVCWDGTGDGIIVVEGEGVVAIQRGASGEIYRLDVRSGSYRRLGWLKDFPLGLDLLPDGRFVMSAAHVRMNLRELPIGAGDLGAGRWLTRGVSIDRQPVYSPDGRWLMFSSNRGGPLDLWEVSLETGELHRITDDPADDWDPAYGPDGSTIFWASNRSGAFEIWTARRDGSAPRQVSRDSLDAENPAATRDGRSVFYSSAHPTKYGLWRVPLDGGEGKQVMRGGTLIPDLSRDGRWLSTILAVGTLEPKLIVLDVETGRTLPGTVTVRPIPGVFVIGRSRWMADGSALVHTAYDRDGRCVLVRRPMEFWRTGVGKPDTLFQRATDDIESFGFSPDGRRATVSILDYLSGLTIAEGVKGIVPPRHAAAAAAR